MYARVLALSVIAASLYACGTTTANATSGPYVSALTQDDAGSDVDIDAGPYFCSGTGPLVALPGANPSAGAAGQCTGDLGKQTFLYAVCSCSDVNVSGQLYTDSIASSGSSDGTGGSIGANDEVQTNSDLEVHGSIWAAAAGGGPAIHVAKAGTVVGDVHANGDVVADATLTVQGALHLATGANATGVVSSSTVREPTAPPCDCTTLLPVTDIIAPFASGNDDAAVGLTAQSLVTAPTTPVTLPCGRYYFDAIGGDALTLSLSGRTAIFVAGDVALGTSLEIDLAPGAEVDLFVGGDMRLHDATIGSQAAPARTRVYMDGTIFTLDGTASLGMNLYAPRADVQLSGDQEMSGALFVGALQLSGAIKIHYDESILATEGCAPPHACYGGSTCTTDTDCCAPLKCRANVCVADVR